MEKNIEAKKLKICFHDNLLTERGTTRAIYNYALFNKKILGNESIIMYDKTKKNNTNVIQKIQQEFKVYGYSNWNQVDPILQKEGCHIIHLIKSGQRDGKLSKVCKNIIHCVFTTHYPHGDLYIALSKYITRNNKIPILPRIISLPNNNDDLRNKLTIPSNAIVFGRHGGQNTFSIQFVKDTIIKIAKEKPQIYFLFVNTNSFTDNAIKNIIYLPPIYDDSELKTFINTCDAHIWARKDGETFGQAIAEFSICNKPVIAMKCGHRAHVDFLGNKAFWYHDENSLYNIITSFDRDKVKLQDWNNYKDYSPEKVMDKYKNFLDRLFQGHII